VSSRWPNNSWTRSVTWLRGRLSVFSSPSPHHLSSPAPARTIRDPLTHLRPQDFEGQKLVELIVNVALSLVGVCSLASAYPTPVTPLTWMLPIPAGRRFPRGLRPPRHQACRLHWSDWHRRRLCSRRSAMAILQPEPGKMVARGRGIHSSSKLGH
jgi:hypothetical protein